MSKKSHTPKLIVLRGPSGAGKSTVARRLLELTKHDVAIIEQDHYRQDLLNHPQGAGKAIRLEMFETDIRIALKHGYDVIVEGILSASNYMPIFEKIWEDHPDENYLFFFDVSFDETVRHHGTRVKSNEFGADEMQEWYELAQRTHSSWETIIPEESSIDETIANIRSVTGI